MFVAGIATAVAMPLAIAAAYALVRLPVRGRRLAYGLVVAALLLPLLALAGPITDQVIAFDRYGTRLSLVPPALVITLPLAIWLCVTVFRDVPWSLRESVRADGATRRQAFVRFALPNVLPGVFVATLLVFVAGCNDFVLGAALSADDDSRPLPATLMLATRPARDVELRGRRGRAPVARAGRPAAARVPAPDHSTPGKVLSMTSIEVRNLTKAGKGGRPLLDDISLTVPSGETLALTGPSGAGKSLLLQARSSGSRSTPPATS